MLKRNFLYHTWQKINQTIPDGFHNLLKLSLLLGMIRSLLDLLGIAIIIPVIQILIQPEIITQNKWLHKIYVYGSFEHNASFALTIMLSVFAVFIIKTIATYYLAKAQSKNSYRITEEIALSRFLSYLHMPYGFYVEQNSSILMRNFLFLPFEFGQRILIPFVQLANEILLVTIIFIAMVCYQPSLFLAVIILLLPFLIAYRFFLRNKLKNISSNKDQSSKALFRHSAQAMQVFREIILFKKFNFFKKKFFSGLHELADLNARINTMNEFSPKVIELIAVTGITVIFLFSWFIQKESAELVQFLVVFALVTSRLLPSTNRIILFSTTIRSNEFVFEHLKNLIPFKESRDINDLDAVPLSFKENIEIKDLAFQYPETNKQTFLSLNLNIKKGETVGIIGPSGSGKTTLLNLLLRLLDESSGGIYVDSARIESRNADSWYKLIGFVPQNINMIDGNFIDNIAFGINPEKIDYEKINEVIKRAELNDLIQQAPLGLETQLGEGGIKISGGQRQRIGIARALYTDAQILIFDEATSSLDTQTEEQITEAIRSLSHKDLTIIIVAHRMQTMKYCDAIYKIENGSLSQKLTYDEIKNS